MKKHIAAIMVVFLCVSVLFASESKTATYAKALGYRETSCYLIGSVAVGIILAESIGVIDPSTEDWDSTREDKVVSEIQSGLTWLANQNPDANVTFVYEVNCRVPTMYEPINRPLLAEKAKWINDTMTFLGFPGDDSYTQVRDYVNDLRSRMHTDWAFAIFVADSLNDTDGRFAEDVDGAKWVAHSSFGGPFTVMCYDNDGYGIEQMDCVTVHEACHLFYATDEYNGGTEIGGYLGVNDTEGASCMMNTLTWSLCPSTREQLGWRDTDSDGIQDIVDTYPKSTLSPQSPSVVASLSLLYSGEVAEIPYPNKCPVGTPQSRENITINTITNVEYRVNGGAWSNATASDGAFDEAEEAFNFAVTFPEAAENWSYLIEARGVNSVGNVEQEYSNDTVTIIGNQTALHSSSPSSSPSPTTQPTASPKPTATTSPSSTQKPTTTYFASPSPSPLQTPEVPELSHSSLIVVAGAVMVSILAGRRIRHRKIN